MDKMLGAISAAPTPWRIRAVTSTAGSGARAHAAEVRTNTVRPMANTRRRPNWSPSLWPPLTGESSGLEDRPADLGAMPGHVGLGERDQVILADRALDADGALGDDRAQHAVGLVG